MCKADFGELVAPADDMVDWRGHGNGHRIRRTGCEYVGITRNCALTVLWKVTTHQGSRPLKEKRALPQYK